MPFFKLAYWFEPFPIEKKARKNVLPYIALLSTLAAILQASGNYLPIVGLFMSAFATFPVMFAAYFSKKSSVYTYVITSLLLIILQPSEFFVFPFTTGLLGLSFGLGLWIVKKRIWIIVQSGILLSAGIVTLLYFIQFPVLGPIQVNSVEGLVMVTGFSLLYSWVFLEICYFFYKRLDSFVP